MTCVGTKEGIDKFCLSLLGRPLAVMHVIDVMLDSSSNLFRSHRYSPLEKLYSVILFIAGPQLKRSEGKEEGDDHRKAGNCNCNCA
jgi:hypothetical protein